MVLSFTMIPPPAAARRGNASVARSYDGQFRLGSERRYRLALRVYNLCDDNVDAFDDQPLRRGYLSPRTDAVKVTRRLCLTLDRVYRCVGTLQTPFQAV